MFGKKPPAEPPPSAPLLRCSFCNKSQRHVRKLVAGPNVNICDYCVDICLDIIAEDRKDEYAPEGESAWSHGSPHECALCRLPVTIDQALVVENRGLICPGCLGEIEAAIAREKPAG